MRFILPASLSAALILSAGAVAAQAWESISTEEQYRTHVVGRTTVIAGSGEISWRADGTATGTWNGQPVVGAWQWQDGYHCRNLRIGSNETGTNCQQIEIRGNELRATADRGTGRSSIATLR